MWRGMNLLCIYFYLNWSCYLSIPTLLAWGKLRGPSLSTSPNKACLSQVHVKNVLTEELQSNHPDPAMSWFPFNLQWRVLGGREFLVSAALSSRWNQWDTDCACVPDPSSLSGGTTPPTIIVCLDVNSHFQDEKQDISLLWPYQDVGKQSLWWYIMLFA